MPVVNGDDRCRGTRVSWTASNGFTGAGRVSGRARARWPTDLYRTTATPRVPADRTRPCHDVGVEIAFFSPDSARVSSSQILIATVNTKQIVRM